MKKRFVKENVRIFLSGTSAIAAFVLTAFMFVSCIQRVDPLQKIDISELYGHTFYGHITASEGGTLTPSLIIYDDDRLDWNMDVGGSFRAPLYYWKVKNSQNNYTLYWFTAGNVAYYKGAAQDLSKAFMVVQYGINSRNEAVVLLSGSKYAGFDTMLNTRLPMTKQTGIPRNTDAPKVPLDPDINDVDITTITAPAGTPQERWGGQNLYTGTFDYLVGFPDDLLLTGHGSCGKDAGGNEITPEISITDIGSNEVKIKTHRFAFDPNMTIQPYDIYNVKVYKAGGVYYLQYTGDVPAYKATGEQITLTGLTVNGKFEGGRLTLRISFKPGRMPFPVTEVFKSN